MAKKKKQAAETTTDIESASGRELTAEELCALKGWNISFLRRARDLYGLKFRKLGPRTFRYNLDWVKQWESERETVR